MKIVLVRHGESEGNINSLVQGQLDYPLTNLGKKQATTLANRLLANNYSFDAIYSSDLSRAAETARIIAITLDIANVVYTPHLRELDLGFFSGRCRWNELSSEDEMFLNSAFKDHSIVIPGGESVNSMVSRIKGFLSPFLDNNAYSSILIVGHGGTLYHILKTILKIFPDTDEWFANCRITEIVKLPELNEWKLVSFNGRKLI